MKKLIQDYKVMMKMRKGMGRGQGSGWKNMRFDDGRRHSLASKGVKSAQKIPYIPPEEKYLKEGQIKEATKDDKITASELAQATGSEERYKWSPIFPFDLTDGANYLAIRGGAYWLMDIVGSYQFKTKFRREPFQVWKLKKVKNKDDVMAEVVADDGNGHVLARQKIPYTDFFDKYEGDEIKLYFDTGVIMLPSEY